MGEGIQTAGYEVHEAPVAGVGCTVTIRFLDGEQAGQQTDEQGSPQVSTFMLIDGPIRGNNDELSIQSAVGQAVVGKGVGEIGTVSSKDGVINYEVEVVEVVLPRGES